MDYLSNNSPLSIVNQTTNLFLVVFFVAAVVAISFVGLFLARSIVLTGRPCPFCFAGLDIHQALLAA